METTDDQALDMLTEKFHRFALTSTAKSSSNSDSVQTVADGEFCEKVQRTEESPSVRNTVSGQNYGISSSINENSLSNGRRDIFPDQGYTLAISQKILKLSAQVLELKQAHSILSDQVILATETFPSHDVLNSLQLLGTENQLLKRKFIIESTERKRLYNEVIELRGNIRVFCRCRPLNQNEIANGFASIVEFDSLDNELQLITSDSSRKQYKFDHIFRPEDNQETVFAQTKPIVTSVLDGYNVCIFAYGQTGTGKTFTMEGAPEQRGVNYRTLEELFRISKERSGIMKYELHVSMLEVYNEKIRDLLADNTQPTKKLEIKQATKGTQEVPGLIETPVYGIDDVWELLKSGSRVRSVGSTSANELSSRSHCLLRITVKGENLLNGLRTKSHLWLVDLAGSERVGRTEVEGERLKESQFINKSLSALGDVISALASKTSHVPYRNSKLTHMLQNSLGGDCKTLMFVQVSPSDADLGETMCSLNFASRVRGVENGPARKQGDHNELIKYKQMVEKLKQDEKETKRLQETLHASHMKLSAGEQICRNLQEKVRHLENHLAEERKTRLKQESRSLAAVSSQPSVLCSGQVPGQKCKTEKPSLGASKTKFPLRRITNFLPPPSPASNRTRASATSAYRKENMSETTTLTSSRSGLARPRRVSIAVRPPPPASSTSQVLQPRRRVSIATVRPDSTSNMTTPLEASASRFTTSSNTLDGRSLIKNRKARYSRLFSPLPKLGTTSESTPIAARSSSKFVRSPTQADSGRNEHQKLVASRRKSFVWSPLKLKALKTNRRPSFLPLRHMEMQH